MNSPFKAECPHCFSTFNLKSRGSAGKKVKCKSCGEPFVVKLIGDTAPADEFDDDIEDYGDVEDYSEAAALPPARSSRGQSGTKKKRRTKGSSSFPRKPVVIALVVIAVGVAGWIGISSLPPGGLLALFDSPEALLDQYIELQYDSIADLEQVNSQDDLEWLKESMDHRHAREQDLIRRMVLLGPLSEERAEEFKKYYEEVQKEHEDKMRDLAIAQGERMQGLNLDPRELRSILTGWSDIRFSLSYVMPTPEPRPDHPVDQFQYELDQAYRKAAQLLVQIDDLSSAKRSVDEVREHTRRFQQLRDHEHQGSAELDSGYFGRGFEWRVLFYNKKRQFEEFLAEDEGVKKAYDDLFFVVESAEERRARTGYTGQNNNEDPAGTASVEREKHIRSLKQLSLAMFNYHEANRSFPGSDRGVNGNVGLSWRVHLLPFLEEVALYRRFDLKSDWQSSQNQVLSNSRPDFFKTPYADGPGQTSLHVFDGPGTPFESGALPRFRDIRDGTSNTIMIFETGRGTGQPWTKPGGVLFNSDNPKANLGQADGGSYLAIMFDGSVQEIPNNIDNERFTRMVRHQDGVPGK